MLHEYMQLFRSDKFNFCADETFDLGKGRNQGGDERTLSGSWRSMWLRGAKSPCSGAISSSASRRV